MASVMIGRCDCPECGFKGAHVKQSEKCAYRYCPECGAQYFAKTERQKTDLARNTRALDASASASGKEPAAEPLAASASASAPASAAPATRKHGIGLFQ